jgi:hypothetical protein
MIVHQGYQELHRRCIYVITAAFHPSGCYRLSTCEYQQLGSNINIDPAANIGAYVANILLLGISKTQDSLFDFERLI